MRETFKVGQHVRLVSGGGCDAANGFTDGDICEVESKGNAGKYDLRIRGLTHRTIGYVNADQLEALTSTLDETTNPADVEWGEVRSAVAAKDWRRAWEVVGTDHTGEATPGEAYIFGNARAWREALERNMISMPRTVGGPFGGHADTVIIDDAPPVTGLFRNPWVDPSPSGDEILRAMQELANETTRYALTVNGERQTYTVPASAMPDIAGALRDFIGQPLTAATRAAVEATVRRVTQDTARIASGNAAISPNPAPHGPNRRRRR